MTHPSQPSTLLITHQAGVARIGLNRPEVRNAFNDTLIAELTQALVQLGQDPSVRCVVLAAQGAAFCAGADLNWMRRMADYTHAQNLADAQGLAELLRTLNECPKPTVARIQGDVYAGGMGLVAACDMAVAVEQAQFCLSEVKLGLVPATISPYVVRAMGLRANRRYALTGERFSASEAHRLGLVHALAATEAELDTQVDAICHALTLASPQAVAATKALLFQVHEAPLDTPLRHLTAEAIAQARASQDGRQGIQAFLSKQVPPWVPSQPQA